MGLILELHPLPAHNISPAHLTLHISEEDTLSGSQARQPICGRLTGTSEIVHWANKGWIGLTTNRKLELGGILKVVESHDEERLNSEG